MAHERNQMLDGLRGIAALLVVAFHAGIILQHRILPGAYLAVDFFFALSGYVLAFSYDGRLGRTVSAWEFMQKRIIRLYPLFLLGALFGSAKMAAELMWLDPPHLTGAPLVAALSLNLIMIPVAWGNNPLFPLDVPAWSLFFELVINLLFATLMLRSKSARTRLVVGISGLALLIASGRSGVGMDIGWNSLTIGLGFIRVAFSFSLGVLIARHAPRAPRPASPLALLFMVMMPLLFSVQAEGNALWIRDAAFTFLLSPLMLIAATEMETPNVFRRLFSRLGDLSYPIYAVHYPILMGVSFIGLRLGLPLVLIFLAGGFLCVMAAAAIEQYVDRPVRRFVSSRLSAGARPHINQARYSR